MAQTLTTEQYKTWKIDPKNLLSFSYDQRIVNFTNKFIYPLSGIDTDDVGISTETEDALMQKLILQAYNCLTKDKMHALSIYIGLIEATKSICSIGCTSTMKYLWQIKIIATILEMYQHINENEFLLSNEILNSIILNFKGRIEKMFDTNRIVLKDVLKKGDLVRFSSLNQPTLNELVTLITFYGIPIHSGIMSELKEGMNQLQVLSLLKKSNLENETVNVIKKLVFEK